MHHSLYCCLCYLIYQDLPVRNNIEVVFLNAPRFRMWFYKSLPSCVLAEIRKRGSFSLKYIPDVLLKFLLVFRNLLRQGDFRTGNWPASSMKIDNVLTFMTCKYWGTSSLEMCCVEIICFVFSLNGITV